MMFGLYISEMKTVETRRDLLSLLPQWLRIAELGVFHGDFSKEIIEVCCPSKLYLVDLFEGEVSCGDKDGENVVTDPDLFQYYAILKDRYKNTPRVDVLKMDTSAFLDTEPVVDIVYIDSAHNYEQVRRELYGSFRNPNILYILGHDYDNAEVRMAVNTFCKDEKLSISYLTNDKCPSYLITV